MGLDKLKKKKPNQLVFKRKDGKRPGYRGRTDANTMSGSGYGAGSSSSSSSSSDDNRENYISQQYTAPAREPEPEYDTADFAFTTPSPSPQPDISGDDQEEDVAQMMVNMGLTPDNAPTGFTPTTGEDGLGEGDYDDGRSLYTSRTQRMKEQEPYIDYRPGPNYVTAQQLSNLNRGLGDSDEQAATLAKIQAVNPIEKQGFFDSGIGKFAKNVGKGLLTLAAPQIGGLAFGKTGYNAVNLGLKGKRAYDLAKRFAPNTTRDITTAFAKYNKNPGTGFEKSTFEGDGDNRPKDVITANVQKFSPKQINNLENNIAFLESVLKAREYGENKLNDSQLLQISNQRNLLIEQYNMIQKMQADIPKTMET